MTGDSLDRLTGRIGLAASTYCGCIDIHPAHVDIEERVLAVLASTEWACDDGHEHEWHGRRRLEQRIKQAVGKR